MTSRFEGSIVALVTPFRGGDVDYAAVRELVEWQIGSGTSGICPAGTTGEGATLSHDEKFRLTREMSSCARGRVPIIAGAGSNDTRTTLELVKLAADAKADGVLVVTPYYNKPPQEGLYRHYEALAKASTIPIVLYNVPGRTSVNMLPETVVRLSKLPNVVAIKEASGSLEQVTQIRASCDICILSGDDALTLPMMGIGAMGVISVAANLIPKEVSALCSSARKGDFAEAEKIHLRWSKLFRALFWETNPIPVKTSMRLTGRLSNSDVRLPLCEMSKEGEGRLKGVLLEYGLMKEK